MDDELAARLGDSAFATLHALLRPAVHSRTAPLPLHQGLSPLQSGVLRADLGGGVVRVTLDHTFTNLTADTLDLFCSLPLPAASIVAQLRWLKPAAERGAQVAERQAARGVFEIDRHGGHAAVLLSAERCDALRYEASSLRPRTALRTIVSWAHPLPTAQPAAARMTVHFEAGAVRQTVPACGSPVRSVVGSAAGRRSEMLVPLQSWVPRVVCGGRQSSKALGRENARLGKTRFADQLTRCLPISKHAVLVACDSASHSAAAWRGRVAGRAARVVVRCEASTSSDGAGWSTMEAKFAALMHHYGASSGAAERAELASRMTTIALQNHWVTLWTSLFASARERSLRDTPAMPSTVDSRGVNLES